MQQVAHSGQVPPAAPPPVPRHPWRTCKGTRTDASANTQMHMDTHACVSPGV